MSIDDFRGVRGSIPWASVVVLFGPNDSGKTNVLDAIHMGLGDAELTRIDLLTDPTLQESPYLGVDVELSGLRFPGSADQEIFLSWARPLLERWGEIAELAPLREQLDLLSDTKEDTVSRSDAIAWLLDNFISIVRDFVLIPPVQDQAIRWDAVEEDVLRLVDLLLESRRFRVECTEVGWLPPTPSEKSAEVLNRLDRNDLWKQKMPLREHFADPAEPIFTFDSEDNLYDFASIVRLNPSSGMVAASLNAEIESFLRRELSRSKKLPRIPIMQFKEGVGSVPSPEVLTAFGLSELLKEDAWLERNEDWVRVHPWVIEACRDLEGRANSLAPPFLRQLYEIKIVPHAPHEWRQVGSRVSARLLPIMPSTDEHAGYDVSVVSSGLATWAGYSMAEAMRQADAGMDAFQDGGPLLSTEVPTVYLIDEPERHLHPLAQEEVGKWITEVVSHGAYVVLATHAPAFLRLPIEDAEYVRVTRQEDRKTALEPISKDILGAVRDYSAEMGLSPAAFLQLARGWLVVEGEDDRRILEGFFGPELRKAGLVILCLRGARRAKASFLNLDVLAPLRIPFFVVLDNVRADAIQGPLADASELTEEERIVEQLIRLREQGNVNLTVHPFPWPDIVCALPVRAVQQVLDDHGLQRNALTDWTDVVSRFKTEKAAGKAKNFKSYVLSSLGLKNMSVSQLIDEALQALDDRTVTEAHPLRGVISRVLALTRNTAFR